jgi:hypothetical protein
MGAKLIDYILAERMPIERAYRHQNPIATHDRQITQLTTT